MTKKMKVARIGLWSAMRAGFAVSAAVGLVVGLFWGMLFAVFAAFVADAASMRDPGFGSGAVVAMPLFGALMLGVVGAVAALLASLVYNLAAGVFGGLELEIEDAGEFSPIAASGNEMPSREVYSIARKVWRRPSVGLARRGSIHPRYAGAGARFDHPDPARGMPREGSSGKEEK